MNKPHEHKDLIHKWADGAEIEAFDPNSGKWVRSTMPVWQPGAQYRIKPAAPVVETKMTPMEIEAIVANCPGPWAEVGRACINAGIARAIADGQVAAFGHEVVIVGRESRAARDMAVAEAVEDAIKDAIHPLIYLYRRLDLAAIIAKVK